MNDISPDYSNCSQPQLFALLRQTDREAFPDRYDEIVREIHQREEHKSHPVSNKPKVGEAWSITMLVAGFTAGLVLDAFCLFIAATSSGDSAVDGPISWFTFCWIPPIGLAIQGFRMRVGPIPLGAKIVLWFGSVLLSLVSGFFILFLLYALSGPC